MNQICSSSGNSVAAEMTFQFFSKQGARESSVAVGSLPPSYPLRYRVLLIADTQRPMTVNHGIHMESTLNTREIGGYPTTDGKLVVGGRIF